MSAVTSNTTCVKDVLTAAHVDRMCSDTRTYVAQSCNKAASEAGPFLGLTHVQIELSTRRKEADTFNFIL